MSAVLDTAPSSQPASVHGRRGKKGLNPKYLPLVATISLFVLVATLGSIFYDGFFSAQVFLNLLIDNAFLIVVAVGMTFVILSGGIDLSVGSVIALTTMVSASLVEKHGWSPAIVIPLVLLMGTAFGAFMGLLIERFRLQPFIVTLAMMVTALGIARLTAGQNNAVLPVYTGSNATADFEMLRSLVFGVIPMPGLFFLGAILIYGAVLRFTPFGRYVYAIGGNEEAARLSGIAAGRVKIVTYAVSGLLAGIAAVLYVAQYRQGKPDAGAGLELDAIAAVVIGGTSLMGGRGSLTGTFCGVLIFGLLSNILQLHNINSNLQLVLKGMIIIGTVLVQERNAGDLLAYLRLPGGQAAHKETTAAKRPSQETPSLNLGGNKK
jgi:ribose/xylose/arabinose/galactoside ABC-type transport system permease subunit